VPGPRFFTFGLWEPRGSVRLALAGRFLRASRFSFLRSALSAMFFVSMFRIMNIQNYELLNYEL
jgi:hypothetical protein